MHSLLHPVLRIAVLVEPLRVTGDYRPANSQDGQAILKQTALAVAAESLLRTGAENDPGPVLAHETPDV